MQYCKVEVKLGGDMLNTVIKSGVSVPEITLLRVIHNGADSVNVLEIEETKKVSSATELERLRREYDSARTEKGERLIDVVFPGVGIKLAEKLSDINDPFVGGADEADEDAEPEPEVVSKKAK